MNFHCHHFFPFLVNQTTIQSENHENFYCLHNFLYTKRPFNTTLRVLELIKDKDETIKKKEKEDKNGGIKIE